MKKIFAFIFFTIISIFGYCNNIKVLASSDSPGLNIPAITKGKSDKSSYQFITLENGLRVLLISDPDTDKAAASMHVFSGQYDDPEDALGIAHFTEHMLFLGTKTYQDPKKYEECISHNQGRNNATTGCRSTIYYFDILQSKLDEALEIFSHFFIAPLFTKDYITNEKQAVNSEFLNGLGDPWKRQHYVDKATANPEHPYSRFSAGNSETLGSDDESLRQKVQDFYKKHYFAENMVLTLYSPKPINQLQQMAYSYFSNVKSVKLSDDTNTDIPIYKAEHLKKLISIETEEDQYLVELRFPIGNHIKQYRTPSAKYIAGMLNRKGPGTLYDLLRQKNWINIKKGVAAEYWDAYNDTSFFDIDFSLTPEGFKNYQKIIEKTFAYLKFIKNQGVNEWRFKEMQKIAQLSFDTATKKSPIGIVTTTTEYINDLLNQDLLTANQLFFEYNQSAITDMLTNDITPRNIRIKRMAKDVFKGQTETEYQIEKWYQVPYTIEDISKDLLKKWENPTILKGISLKGDILWWGCVYYEWK